MLMTLEYLKNIVGRHKVKKFNMGVIDAVSGGIGFQTIDAFYCWFEYSLHFQQSFCVNIKDILKSNLYANIWILNIT